MNLGKIVKGLAVGAGLVGMAGGCGPERRSGPGGTGGNYTPSKTDAGVSKVCNNSPLSGMYLWSSGCEWGTTEKLGSDCEVDVEGADYCNSMTIQGTTVQCADRSIELIRSFDCATDVDPRTQDRCGKYKCAFNADSTLYLEKAPSSLILLSGDILDKLMDQPYQNQQHCINQLQNGSWRTCFR